MKIEYTTCTATSSPEADEYWVGRKEGYKAGKKQVIEDFNDRLMSWLMVGALVGLVIGYTLSHSFWLFASIIGLIYLCDKVNKITPNRDNKLNIIL